MHRTITVELPDEVYARLAEAANAVGKTPEQLLATLAKAHYLDRPLTQSRLALLRFAGSVNTGDPHSADTARIDADLARESLSRVK